MKIEIDLNDIIGDEDGTETLSDSVRRQVVEKLTGSIQQNITSRIDEEVSKTLSESMSKAVAEQMPKLIDDLMNAEYTPVSDYGQRKAPTTFRDELIKCVTSQMVYKTSTYSSDRNAFTTAVDSVIAGKVAQFKIAFDKEVDSKLVADAMAYASQKLSERLGIKK